MSENKNAFPKKDENDFVNVPSVSSGDMTGLIPSGIDDEDLYAYEEIYPYLPNDYKDIMYW